MMNGDLPPQQQPEEARARHISFVESLERHASGNNGRAAWSSMATELGWTVDEVQTYAYRYMMSLNESDDRSHQAATRQRQVEQQQHDSNRNDNANMHQRNDSMMNNKRDNDDNATNNNQNSDKEWTLEEDMLLDALLAFQLPYNNNDSNQDEWEEQVASGLPGRTPMQVRRRYNELYGNSRGTTDGH